jgi:hypothetical protein
VIFRQIGDILHARHTEMIACFENALFRRRSVLHLEGGHWARHHGVAWMVVWRLVVDLVMPRLQQCSCKGSGASGVHGLGGLLESMEDCSRSV